MLNQLQSIHTIRTLYYTTLYKYTKYREYTKLRLFLTTFEVLLYQAKFHGPLKDFYK